MRISFLVAAILLVSRSFLCAQDTLRMYFIGNSLSAGQESMMPELGRAAGVNIYGEKSSYVYTMKQAYETPAIMEKIRNNRWNYVFLQVNPYQSPSDLSIYTTYTSRLIDSVRAAGATPGIYICMNTYGSDMGQVADSCLRLARRKNVAVIPVNMAFRTVAKEYPTLPLYGAPPDWVHPGAAGRYLVSCMFLSAVLGKNPIGLPSIVNGVTDAATRRYLQVTAWNTVMADSLSDVRFAWNPAPVFPAQVTLNTGGASIVQYFKRNINTMIRYENNARDTSEAGVYYSLDPSVLSINYDGEMTALALGQGRIVGRLLNRTDTTLMTVTSSSATLDSLRILPRVFSGFVFAGQEFSVTGHFREGAYVFSRDISTAVTWETDTAILKIVNRKLVRFASRQDTVTVKAVIGPIRDSITLVLAPELTFTKRIRFQTDTVPISPYWNADNGMTYSDARGHGWVTKTGLFSRSDRYGTIFEKSLVSVSAESEYKIKCTDADYIIKVSMGDNQYGSTDYIRFVNPVRPDGKDTIMTHTGRSNGVKIDTLRVFGMDGIHLGIKGAINYLVIISKEGVDINDVAMDDGSSMDIEGRTAAPACFFEVSPNPFNPELRIRMRGNIPPAAEVRLAVYDCAGRRVKALTTSGANLGKGLAWNTAGYAAGIYFIEGRLPDGGIYRQRAVLVK